MKVRTTFHLLHYDHQVSISERVLCVHCNPYPKLRVTWDEVDNEKLRAAFSVWWSPELVQGIPLSLQDRVLATLGSKRVLHRRGLKLKCIAHPYAIVVDRWEEMTVEEQIERRLRR